MPDGGEHIQAEILYFFKFVCEIFKFCKYNLALSVKSTCFLLLQDRHGVGNRRPFPDVQQDYFLKGAEETNGQTILKFERSFDTCDSHDYKVTVRSVIFKPLCT